MVAVIIAIVIMGIIIVVLGNKVLTLQKQVNLLDKEQHTQNNEIAVLMRNHLTHQGMLLEHIEILKYLIEQDPKLNSGKLYFTGPVGEA
jgi:predicted Holliday junction resolvase-like endonuclease